MLADGGHHAALAIPRLDRRPGVGMGIHFAPIARRGLFLRCALFPGRRLVQRRFPGNLTGFTKQVKEYLRAAMFQEKPIPSWTGV